MMIMSQNKKLATVRNGRKAKSEKPNQTKIARRKSERRMAPMRIVTFRRCKKKKLAIRTMHRPKKAAEVEEKRSSRPKPQAVLHLIRVNMTHLLYSLYIAWSSRINNYLIRFFCLTNYLLQICQQSKKSAIRLIWRTLNLNTPTMITKISHPINCSSNTFARACRKRIQRCPCPK